MSLRVATWPWLAIHELRLFRRGTQLGVGRFRFALNVAGGLFLLHALAFAILFAWMPKAWRGPELPPDAAVFLGFLAWFLFSLILASAVTKAVDALYSRGDLDLLLSSPIRARTVLTVRVLTISINSILWAALFVLPVAHVGALLGMPQLLSLYPLLFAFGLIAGCLATFLVLALVRWLGARRALAVGQIMGALFGAAFYFSLQFSRLLGTDLWLQTMGEWLIVEGPRSIWAKLLAFPAYALWGDVPSITLFLLIGVGAIVATSWLLEKVFLSRAQETISAQPRRLRGHYAMRTRFASLMLRKEWRLIRRSPSLISGVLLQILYLVPLFFLPFVQSATGSGWIAAGAILLACSLTANLCALTISAEEAPDLLLSAPISIERARGYKLLAALIPTWLLISPLIAFAIWQHALIGLMLTVIALAATASIGALHVWAPLPRPRHDLGFRRGRISLMRGLTELAMMLLWSATAYAANTHSYWGWVTAVLALFPLIGVWRKRERFL